MSSMTNKNVSYTVLKCFTKTNGDTHFVCIQNFEAKKSYLAVGSEGRRSFHMHEVTDICYFESTEFAMAIKLLPCIIISCLSR